MEFGSPVPTKYQGVNNFTRWHCHLTFIFSPRRTFSPGMDMLTSCGHSYLEWTFLPHMGISTSCGHSYLMWQDHFLRYVGVSPPPSEKSPCLSLLTSHGHSHLMLAFSPHIYIVTSGGHSHLAWAFLSHKHSHLVWMF